MAKKLPRDTSLEGGTGVDPTGAAGGLPTAGGATAGGPEPAGEPGDPEYDAWLKRQAAAEREKKRVFTGPPTLAVDPNDPNSLVRTPRDLGYYGGIDPRLKQLQGYLDAAPGRGAPQAAGVSLGPANLVNGVQMGPLARMTGAQLGPADQSQMAALGPAGQAREGGPFAGAQGEALAYQQSLMRGENSVAGLQGQREMDQLMAQQQAMAAGASPSQRAMMQRTAAQNMGRIGTDMASRIQEAQLAERSAAAGHVGTIAGQGRSAEQQLGMFNVGEANQFGALGAQLGTNVNLANTGARNQFGLTQAGFNQQAGMENMQAENLRNFQQGNFDQSGQQFNAGALNQFATTGAELDQRTQQTNVEAQLRQMGLNDAQIAQMLLLQQGAAGMQQTGTIKAAEMDQRDFELQQQKELHLADNELQSWLALTNNQADMDQIKAQLPADWEKMLSAGVPLLTILAQSGILGGDKTKGDMAGTGMNAMTGAAGGGGGGGGGWGGAAGGAASGALVGAGFGPYGALIGGVAGGLYGYFG